MKRAVRTVIAREKSIGGWRLQPPVLAEGAFGVVIPVENAAGVKGVMKVESASDKTSHVPSEAMFGNTLADCPNVVRFLGSGEEKGVLYHVTERLGETLTRRVESWKKDTNDCEIIDTLNKVAADLLEAFKCIHAHNLVYVDLKPDNIVWDPVRGHWTLIDLGSMTPPVQLNRYVFNGTPKFASTRALLHGGSRFSDDIASLIYVLMWALAGKLPWDHLKTPKDIAQERDRKVDGRTIGTSVPRLLEPFRDRLENVGAPNYAPIVLAKTCRVERPKELNEPKPSQRALWRRPGQTAPMSAEQVAVYLARTKTAILYEPLHLVGPRAKIRQYLVENGHASSTKEADVLIERGST